MPEIKLKPIRLHCQNLKCRTKKGHIWTPRKKVVKVCPRCNSKRIEIITN